MDLHGVSSIVSASRAKWDSTWGWEVCRSRLLGLLCKIGQDDSFHVEVVLRELGEKEKGDVISGVDSPGAILVGR